MAIDCIPYVNDFHIKCNKVQHSCISTLTINENQSLTLSFQVIIKVYRDIKEIQLRKYYKASDEGKNAIEISPTKVVINCPPNKSS